jgi:hypothetical protein
MRQINSEPQNIEQGISNYEVKAPPASPRRNRRAGITSTFCGSLFDILLFAFSRLGLGLAPQSAHGAILSPSNVRTIFRTLTKGLYR